MGTIGASQSAHFQGPSRAVPSARPLEVTGCFGHRMAPASRANNGREGHLTLYCRTQASQRRGHLQSAVCNLQLHVHGEFSRLSMNGAFRPTCPISIRSGYSVCFSRSTSTLARNQIRPKRVAITCLHTEVSSLTDLTSRYTISASL